MKKINFYIGKKNGVAFLLALFILIYALYAFFDEVVYFFSEETAVDLGDAMNLNEEAFAKVKTGDYVQVKGITSIQGGSIERGLFAEKHLIYYLNGSSKFIIDSVVKDKKAESGPQYKTVKGRAYPFKASDRAAKMREFFLKSFMIEMDEEGIFIEDGVVPGEDYFSLSVFIFLIALAGTNIFFLIKPLIKKDALEEMGDLDELN